MADEKEFKAEELTDEQMNDAAGGGSGSVKTKKCATKTCFNKIPDIPAIKYCQDCLMKMRMQTTSV